METEIKDVVFYIQEIYPHEFKIRYKIRYSRMALTKFFFSTNFLLIILKSLGNDVVHYNLFSFKVMNLYIKLVCFVTLTLLV